MLGIVKKLKRGKAVGPDVVSKEMLKFGGGRVWYRRCVMYWGRWCRRVVCQMCG